MVDARIWTAPRGMAYCGPAAMSPPPPDHQTSDPAPSCGKLHNPLIQPMLDAPHAFYARARREEPIFFSEAAGAWIITRHEDICAIARDVARFSSVGILDGGPGMPPEVIAELMRGFPPVRGIVDSDAPYHTRVRALANKALSLRRTAAFEPRIRAIAEHLIDGFVERGHVELVRAFALPLPGSFIVDLFGFPREDLPLFTRWSDDWIGFASYSDAPLEKIVGHARGSVPTDARADQRHGRRAHVAGDDEGHAGQTRDRRQRYTARAGAALSTFAARASITDTRAPRTSPIDVDAA